MSILRNRHIKVNPQCPICKSGAEDILHLIFKCTRAQEVLKNLSLDKIIAKALCTNCSGSVVLKELLRNTLKKRPVLGQLGLQEKILVGASNIWWERKEAVKGSLVKTMKSSTFAIQAITTNHVSRPAAPAGLATWERRAPGQYKLNTDAAFLKMDSGQSLLSFITIGVKQLLEPQSLLIKH